MELEKYIGQVIDNRYKIVKVIGKGGMAIVFEAMDLGDVWLTRALKE